MVLDFFRNLYRLALLFLSPNHFKQSAIADDDAHVLREARKVKPDYTPSSEHSRDMEVAYSQRTRALRRGIGMSLFLILAAVALAWFTVWLMQKAGFSLTPDGVRWLQLASLLLVVWATLSELGWEMQSWSGRTLPERLNKFWFRTLYFLGTYVVAITFFSG